MRSVKKGDKRGLLPPRQQRLIIHLLRQLILIELEHIRHLADGDVRAIIKVVHNVLHPADLEAVDDEVHNRHFLVRKTALRRDARHTCAERLAQRAADGVRVAGDNQRRFAAVDALDYKIDDFQPDGVGDNGIQGENPAGTEQSGEDVQHDVVAHDERADGHAELAGENDRHDFHAVHRAAAADGKPAADARNQSAEERTEQQIRPGKRRGNADVKRQRPLNQPRAEGVNEHGIHGVNGELHALPLQPEEEQRHVEQSATGCTNRG